MTWIKTEDRGYEGLAAARREGFVRRRVARWHWQSDSETAFKSVRRLDRQAGRPDIRR